MPEREAARDDSDASTLAQDGFRLSALLVHAEMLGTLGARLDMLDDYDRDTVESALLASVQLLALVVAAHGPATRTPEMAWREFAALTDQLIARVPS